MGMNKNGIWTEDEFSEKLRLSDGSYWALILHHDNQGGKYLFTSSNAGRCSELNTYSRLEDLPKYTPEDGVFEFLVIQQEDNDMVTYRWTQTNEPTTTSAVTGFAVVSGYSNPGGGICKRTGDSNTYLAITASNSWWNACGCSTAYQGGIPGFGNKVITGPMLVYVRVNKHLRIGNSAVLSSEIIEY